MSSVFRRTPDSDTLSLGRSPTISKVFCLFVFVCCAECQGQPPFLVATGGRQERVHDGTNNPQTFKPQKWNLIAPQSRAGATVIWEATPFQHVDQSEYEADTLMNLSVRLSTQNSNWMAVKSSDGTNIDNGNRHADVVAMSTGRGNAQVELTVTFLESPNQFAIVGDYVAVVVATITEN